MCNQLLALVVQIMAYHSLAMPVMFTLAFLLCSSRGTSPGSRREVAAIAPPRSHMEIAQRASRSPSFIAESVEWWCACDLNTT